MLKGFLNNYFGFNKQQRNGLLVLAFISLSLLLVRLIFPYFIEQDKIIIQNLQLIEREIDSSYNTSKNYSSTNTFQNKKTSSLFFFNPNTVSFNQLMQLGFKEKTAKTFLKFRDKGFVFKQKSDIKKIYGISDYFYLQLEPYILIESRLKEPQQNINENVEKTSTTSLKKNAKIFVELNIADSIALTNLSGIGPAFAKRILKYRSLLGGFVKCEQLKEVYGFTNELYSKISPYIKVDETLIRKININKDDFKSINKHPYLSYNLTKTIFDWRKKATINNNDLKNILQSDSLFDKLLPYIVFE